MEASQLHFHSIGQVTQDKKADSSIIQVMKIEFRFGAIETVVDIVEEEETQYQSSEGEEVIKVLRGNSISAKWLKLNSNRVRAPDVRRDDKVLIWRMGNTDQYYWTDLNTSNVKRLETVVWAWSADPKNPIADDLSNAIRLEVSSHSKAITLITPQPDGEPFGYTFQIDYGGGVVQMTDTAENTAYINSADTIIGFRNADTTEFRLDKKNIHMYAPDSMYVTAENTVAFKCTDFTLDASKSITFNTTSWSVNSKDTIDFKTKDWTVNSNTSVSIVSPTVMLESQTVTSNAPTTIATGLLKCAGLSVGGGGNTPGGLCVVNNFATFEKGLEVNGGLKADTITADNGTFNALTVGGKAL